MAVWHPGGVRPSLGQLLVQVLPAAVGELPPCSEEALVPPAADGAGGCGGSSFHQTLLNHADWKVCQHSEPPAAKATLTQCGSLILLCPLDIPELERVTCGFFL